MKIIKYLSLILVSLFLFSCASKPPLNDDAVRINLDKVEDLEKFNPYIEPNTGKQRNPSTLRGNVFSITKIKSEEGEKQYVVFLDALAFHLDDSEYEFIPLDYVDLQGPKLGVSESWFENYNNPLDHDAIREVEIVEVLDKGCGCSKITCPDCKFECPFPWEKRANNRYPLFFEAKFGIASYADKSPLDLTARGFDRPFGEFATGYRFGDRSKRHFALGLSYFTGIQTYENLTGELLNRDALMLYGKYTFNEWSCVFPYIYSQIGASLDVNTLYLGRISLASKLKGIFNYECDCEADLDADAQLKQELAFKSPDIDLSIPISLGFGVGVDIPVNSILDLSIDLGYKYMQVGETTLVFDYKVPYSKPYSIYTLRLGLNF